MAVPITAADVKAGFATTIPDAEINLLISVVDGADACMDANSVDADTQELMKIAGVRHMLSLMDGDGRGKATSESAPSGASRSFAQWSNNGSNGISTTRYGVLLRQLDKFGCIVSILSNASPLQLRSVGRRDPDTE